MLFSRSGLMGAILGPLEVLETVGLSSVYLAMVANKRAGVIGNLVVGAIVALLLHGLNVALGVLSPTIQSLRLHYVDFFRQFHHGGGEYYRPFKIERS